MPARKDEPTSEDLIRAAHDAIFDPSLLPPDEVVETEAEAPPATEPGDEPAPKAGTRPEPPARTTSQSEGLRYPAPPSTPIPTTSGGERRRRPVVVGAWLIGILVAGVLALNAIESESEGGGSAEIAVDTVRTEVGNCFDSPALLSAEGSVALEGLEHVPCSEAHDFETFALTEYPASPDEAFPGHNVLVTHGAAECVRQIAGYVGVSWLEAGYFIQPLYPNEDGWESGDREIQCALRRVDGLKAEGSAGGAGSIVPDNYVPVHDLDEGECFDETGWLSFGLPISCDDVHGFEVYAVLTSPEPPGAEAPNFDQVEAYADSICNSEYIKRVDPAVATNTYHSAYTYPTPLSWMLGQRAYVCVVWNQDLSPLTGSVLLAQTRLDAVSQTVLGASAPAVHYPDFASVDGLALIGSTHQDGEAVALTAFAEHVQRDAPFQTERLQRGAMWYDEEVPVANGFETVFAFQLEQYSWFTIGDGFAFVIQNHSAHAFGGDIGYQHIPNSVAVEFDSFRQASQGDPKATISEAPDLLANHVSVHTKGVGSNDTHIAASLGWAGLEPVVLADRAAHVVLIRYVPGEMTIYVDQFESPVLTVDIDLAKILDLDAGAAYLGFTASSGPRITGHKILGWELATTTTP